MLTEGTNPKTATIDRLPTLDILRLMNDEDATVAAAVRRALPAIAEAVDTIAARLRDGGRLIYIGAGTSGRLGVLDASESVPTFSVPEEIIRGIIAGGDYALRHAVEGAEDDYEAGYAAITARDVTARDVVVGIAASGRIPYVLGAIAAAEAAGAATIGVACNDPSPLLERAQIAIGAVVGPEAILRLLSDA